MLELDPDFFQAYVDFSSLPWTDGVLEPKVKELIYTAFDASATHMYVPGLRQHVENALAYGATPAEVMEVFELASRDRDPRLRRRAADPRGGAGRAGTKAGA